MRTSKVDNRAWLAGWCRPVGVAGEKKHEDFARRGKAVVIALPEQQLGFVHGVLEDGERTSVGDLKFFGGLSRG